MWTQREKHKEDIELVSVRTAENFKIAMLWIYGAFITFSMSLLVVSLSYICIFKSANSGLKSAGNLMVRNDMIAIRETEL